MNREAPATTDGGGAEWPQSNRQEPLVNRHEGDVGPQIDAYLEEAINKIKLMYPDRRPEDIFDGLL